MTSRPTGLGAFDPRNSNTPCRQETHVPGVLEAGRHRLGGERGERTPCRLPGSSWPRCGCQCPLSVHGSRGLQTCGVGRAGQCTARTNLLGVQLKGHVLVLAGVDVGDHQLVTVLSTGNNRVLRSQVGFSTDSWQTGSCGSQVHSASSPPPVMLWCTCTIACRVLLRL